MKLGLSLSSARRSTDALVIGENSIDLVATVAGLPDPDSKRELVDFDAIPGGEAASAAVALARLRWQTKYIGRYGDDYWGERGRASLAAENVDVSEVVVSTAARSRCAVVLVDRERGSRTVLWKRDAALSLQPQDIPDQAIADSRVVLVGSDDVAAMTSAAKRARRFGVRAVGDLERIHPGTEALLRELDVIVMAPSFPTGFTGHSSLATALREIAAMSAAPLVVVTLGEEGCLALAAGTEVRVPAFNVDVVDTTGAGDLFRAGLIARWLAEPAGPNISELLRYGSAVAALGCQTKGAWRGAPRPEDVQALLTR